MPEMPVQRAEHLGLARDGRRDHRIVLRIIGDRGAELYVGFEQALFREPEQQGRFKVQPTSSRVRSSVQSSLRAIRMDS
jgi:hypothetical protein